MAFIAIVVFAAPVLATLILWTRWQKEGKVLFGLSMAGSLMFGLFYHFIVGGADNVIGLSGAGWIGMFRATAVLLAAIEASSCAWVVKHVWRHGSYV